MKQIFTLLAFLLISITTFAQGIAVQGIARDNTNAAIKNETLSFDFRITNTADAVLFRETQQIRTDNFGLFSHVVSTGTAADGTVFNNVDFSQQGLKLIVWIEYQGNNVQVYNQPLQYVPYAHFAKKAENAANGVPPGTVVAFLGDDDKIPAGWVKAAGQNIATGNQYAALRAVIGNTIPDLRGRFLKGNGSGNIPVTAIDENTPIRGYQGQSLQTHGHAIDITRNTNTTGAHGHKITKLPADGTGVNLTSIQSLVESDGSDENWQNAPTDIFSNANHTTIEGNHNHSVRINGDTTTEGGEENRPWTVIVNYIIKL